MTSHANTTIRPDLLQRLAVACMERRRTGLLRSPQVVEYALGPAVVVDNRRMIGFCSNDYLGLARHPAVIAALRQAALQHGVGSTAAHLVCGHHREHAMLEEALADWTGRERVLLFSSGVAANLGVMQALLGRGDLCVQDKLNHASLLDGARGGGALLRRYPHADVDGANRHLSGHEGAAALLATDGVFSMDGDTAPLRELAALCARHRATMMVDDAHGLGVLGDDGAGSVSAARLSQHEVPVLMGTLGKALGTAGAFVAGSAATIEGLTQFARSHVYSTALPPALAAATRVAVQLARREDWRREKLAASIARFRRGATQLGLPLMPSTTPIQPLPLGDSRRALDAAHALREAGMLVAPIRPPTVPAGTARLRITLSAAHEEADIDRLLDALATVPLS